MAEKIQWSGRLGVEIVSKTGKLNGCCVKAILKWNPRMLGVKSSCLICETSLKSVRAGDDLAPGFTGGVNDFRKVEAADLVIGALAFDGEKFASEEDVADWIKDRDVDEPDCIQRMNEDAFYAPIEALADGTARYVKIGMGVLAEVGFLDKNGAVVAGAGSGSNSPLGITTTSLASGGMVDPAQSPGQRINSAAPFPSVIKGLTEMQDGHTHEINFVACPESDGVRVKGMTSYVNGHVHMVEAALAADGSLDTRTAPDQAPVGGHAHQHRIVWRPGMGEPTMKEKTPIIDTFKSQLSAAFDKAKGKAKTSILAPAK